MSSVMAPKAVLLLNTHFIPSVKLCITGSPIFGFIIGFFPICDKARIAKTEQIKTEHIDQCTPIKVIEKPAAAGPITEAICQTELLHVDALGYTFLGTNSDKKEKMVGPRKALTSPPRKTKK